MPSLCNSTLSSSPDLDAFQYWSSFSEKPFCCGERLQVYKGKLNGKGPRGGDFSAVKVFVDQPGTETRCRHEVAKARTASELLGRFLRQAPCGRRRARFAQLQTAPVDQVSMLNRFFSHNKRQPSSGEWVLLEEMVQERGCLAPIVDRHGRMYRESTGGSTLPCWSWGHAHTHGHHHHNNNKVTQGQGSGGWSSSPGGSTCSVQSRELLEAFVHFSFQASGGQLVVCSLEGAEDEHGRLALKTPVIHSLHTGFGETDKGPAGLRAVMGRHACNDLCRQILSCPSARPSSSSSSHVAAPPYHLTHPMPPPPTFFPRQRLTPSAPLEEDDDEINENVNVEFRGSLPSAPPYSEEDEGLDLGDHHDLHGDVFPEPPDYSLQALHLYLQLEAKGLPREPPPPYTEFIEDLI